MEKELKVLMTGGHAGTTAIATVQEFNSRNKTPRSDNRTSTKIHWKQYWVGASQALEGKTIPTIESSALPKLGVECHTIISGKLQRRLSLWTLPSLIRVPLGFFHALLLLTSIKPDVVLSFGGFVALPVVVAAKILGIPIILHEQTVAVGLANKLSSPFAEIVTLARPESKKYFTKKKTVLIGNPLMRIL